MHDAKGRLEGGERDGRCRVPSETLPALVLRDPSAAADLPNIQTSKRLSCISTFSQMKL